jgi:hypothetical protein
MLGERMNRVRWCRLCLANAADVDGDCNHVVVDVGRQRDPSCLSRGGQTIDMWMMMQCDMDHLLHKWPSPQ